MSPKFPKFEAAAHSLAVLDYISDLFTGAGKETFTREEVLVVLNHVKHDPDVFSPESVLAYEQAMEDAGVNQMYEESD